MWVHLNMQPVMVLCVNRMGTWLESGEHIPPFGTLIVVSWLTVKDHDAWSTSKQAGVIKLLLSQQLKEEEFVI